MAKHEHMSTPRALAHAALIGHLARATVLEGKTFDEAVKEARRAVGPDSEHFVRHRVTDPYAGRPMMDEAFYPSIGL